MIRIRYRDPYRFLTGTLFCLLKHCVGSSSRYQCCILYVSLLVLFVTGFMVSGKLTKIPFEILEYGRLESSASSDYSHCTV